MTPSVPTPTAKAFAKLPRQQLLELRSRIEEALNEPDETHAPARTDNRNHCGTRLTLAQKEFLKELAAIKGTNVSEEVRQAVLHHIRRQDESLVVAIKTAL
jgi:hypothetical protein